LAISDGEGPAGSGTVVSGFCEVVVGVLPQAFRPSAATVTTTSGRNLRIFREWLRIFRE
jgi:hypothetical protein